MRPTSPPLSAPVLYILLALSEGKKHGYGIMQEVERETDGRISLGPGTLYGSLDRLLAATLVEECDASNSRRRYYRLSSSGRLALKHELERMRMAVESAKRRGLLSPAKAGRP